MCARFTLRPPSSVLAAALDMAEPEGYGPRYNIAPSQPVLAIRPAGQGQGREYDVYQWGLVPSWAKDPKMGARMINARAETLFEKPAFRAAIKYRRCLLPADGWYEWRAVGKSRLPFHIHREDGQPFTFATLWEHWESPLGDVLDSCAIVTMEAKGLFREVHHRMPLILHPEERDAWLSDETAVRALLASRPAEGFTLTPVSTWVNHPRHEGPQCLAPPENQPASLL